jgi:hypothetical protein
MHTTFPSTVRPTASRQVVSIVCLVVTRCWVFIATIPAARSAACTLLFAPPGTIGAPLFTESPNSRSRHLPLAIPRALVRLSPFRLRLGNATAGGLFPSATSSSLIKTVMPRVPTMEPADAFDNVARRAATRVDEAMCVGYLMFNLMNGVLVNNKTNVTLAGLTSTARACNNLAYCETVLRITNCHSVVDGHIRKVLRSSGASKPLIRHLMAAGSTLKRVHDTTVFKLRNKRRRVYFSSKTINQFMLAHGAAHFLYDASTSVVANGARLLTLVDELTESPQTNQTALGPATPPG